MYQLPPFHTLYFRTIVKLQSSYTLETLQRLSNQTTSHQTPQPYHTILHIRQVLLIMDDCDTLVEVEYRVKKNSNFEGVGFFAFLDFFSSLFFVLCALHRSSKILITSLVTHNISYSPLHNLNNPIHLSNPNIRIRRGIFGSSYKSSLKAMRGLR